MRIALITHEYPPAGGGGAALAEALARALAARGHGLEVFTQQAPVDLGHEENSSIVIHRIPCGARSAAGAGLMTHLRFVRRAARAVEAAHRTRAFDILHAHFIVPAGAAAGRAARRMGIPYVVTAHGSDVPGHNPQGYDRALALLRPFWKRVVRGAARTVAPSEYLLGRIRRAAGGPLRAVRIANGVDPSRFATDVPEERSVLFVGRLIMIKGVEVLIRAAAALPDGWRVDIVGDGPLADPLAALARELGVDARVHGRLGGDALLERYARAAVFALPSWVENFSMVLLEAMAAGKAIVALDAGGNREVLGEHARLVAPGDPDAFGRALAELAGSEEARLELGRAARRRVEEELSIEAVAGQYERTFQQVLAEAGA